MLTLGSKYLAQKQNILKIGLATFDTAPLQIAPLEFYTTQIENKQTFIMAARAKLDQFKTAENTLMLKNLFFNLQVEFLIRSDRFEKTDLNFIKAKRSFASNLKNYLRIFLLSSFRN